MKRISVQAVVPDATARNYVALLRSRLPGVALSDIVITRTYTLDAKLSDTDLKKSAERLANPLTEAFSLSGVFAPEEYTYAVEIGYLPGVTDNVGKTAQETIEDSIGRRFKAGSGVYTATILFISGAISHDDAQRIALELHNPLIERASIYPGGTKKFPITLPVVKLKEALKAEEVDLEVSDDELKRIGKEGIKNTDGTRRGPLALSLKALKIVRDHYREIGRTPTDVELESIAQTWSEHCKHTIFADPLDEVKEGIYRRYIKGATEKIRRKKGKNDFCVSVFKDNSGAIAFDDDHLIAHKVETHNSPSALDPFGGSITAIVGVNRDCLGFGLGAKPVANVYGFCVADPADETPYYRDKERTQKLLSNRRILEGVIKGINAGGNESGIPTPLGFVAIDPSFRSKPLVYGGTVGLIPRKSGRRVLYEKSAQPGDLIVMAGGRVGLDGIHGATFSSESLSSGSPATAVQIGDPITQKKLSDAIIREARDKALYSSITDNGAGGLSCAVAEMAKECGGCDVDLEKVPLKYPGLAPWQIWISESQERMTLAVPKKHWLALKKIFDRHGVEASVIGKFTDSGACIVRYKGKKVMDMSMDFLHDGRPVEVQKSKKPKIKVAEPAPAARLQDLHGAIFALLERPNIGSTSFIAQQYDHEVQGSSVVKPLQGKGRVSADAAVIRPVLSSQKGVALAHGITSWYSRIDTYAMAAAAVDTAIRNALCVGATRDHLAILDNFCWSTSNTPERLYELKRAALALYDTAVAYGTPYISGKDSMFNDFRGFDAAGKPVHIAALPTVLVSAIGVMHSADAALTLDLKSEGDTLYLLGETNDELGASEYYAMLSEKYAEDWVGKKVPQVNTSKNIKVYDALEQASKDGLLASATSLGRGGLASALCKSAIGGQIGASVDLRDLPGNANVSDSILFSESQGRVLVSVRSGREAEFETLVKKVPYARLGHVGGFYLGIKSADQDLSLDLSALTSSYRSFFKDW